MQNLGDYKGDLERIATVAGKESKSYLIQTKHLGMNMDDYLDSKGMFDDYLGSKRRLPIQQVLNLAINSARQIELLHTQRILHCDIKPNNFLYDEKSGRVTVIDFGLSKFLPPNKTCVEESAAGTEGFMAPEIDKGMVNPALKVTYSAASDIYALGKMFWELRFFNRESLKDLALRMMSPSPEKRPSISEVIKTLQTAKNNIEISQAKAVVGKLQEQLKLQKQLSSSTKRSVVSWIFKNQREKAKNEIERLDKLINILNKYDLEACGYKPQDTDETATEIVKLLKENQARHNETKHYMASKFNCDTLQILPSLLREAVCDKLGIKDDSDLRSGKETYFARKELAEIIKEKIKNDEFINERPSERRGVII